MPSSLQEVTISAEPVEGHRDDEAIASLALNLFPKVAASKPK